MLQSCMHMYIHRCYSLHARTHTHTHTHTHTPLSMGCEHVLFWQEFSLSQRNEYVDMHLTLRTLIS